MKTASYPLIATLALALAGSLSSTLAQAQTTGQSLSRDEVVAELARARADGELDHADEELGLYTAAASQRQARILARSQKASQPTAIAGSTPAAAH